ncbi:hypothetical protein [Sphaerisporangium sp. TRM90804]|uniref:hypothetical protein n=1 Tax=Sphaerisporangium sp. TRM90804 TaxID=3031113 RepID=UPI002447729E|nr:hypothetical protein [Sphaerisporangium sp. TRM90804]MDH2424050.1 hypothetical protein [Sphaerisporangium sp. TRM90804]
MDERSVMRRGDRTQARVAPLSWTDPRACAANAAGAVTPEQWALIAGPRVGQPYGAWALLGALAALMAGSGALGAAGRGIAVEGGPAGALGMMAFMMVVMGWMLLAPALFAGVPRWVDRRRRRRVVAGLTAARIVAAAGRVVAEPNHEAGVRVGPNPIPVPRGAPALPPPGTYRLYWLESVAKGPGPLLLSAEPMDAPPTPAGVRTPARVPGADEEGPSPAEATGGAQPGPAEGRAGSSPDAVMGCTEADLAEGRAGRLTRGQRWSLVRRAALHALAWALGGLVCVGLFMVPVVFALAALLTRGGDVEVASDSLGTLWVALPFSVIAVFALGAGIANSRMVEMVAALRAATPVRRVTGEVSVRGGGRHWWVSTGGLRFAVTMEVAQAFLPPGRYALYHLPYLGMLLSAESLPPEPAAPDPAVPEQPRRAVLIRDRIVHDEAPRDAALQDEAASGLGHPG